VGRRCILAGSTQVSGYSTIGDNVWIGPSAVIGNKLSIGTGARIEIGSVVVDDVPPGRTVSGNFAYDHLRRVRAYARDLKP
jgi:UDP-3-O-[3-hydroxymyristoyl] glucosamine N-acyltransferase